MNITHTPPSLPDADGAPAANSDPGLIGNLTLVATSFNTGSYGWKGSKRITVELQNGDGGAEKEKVQVMLTCVTSFTWLVIILTDPFNSINAAVLGSKSAAADEGEENDKEEEKETADEDGEAEADAEGAKDE